MKRLSIRWKLTLWYGSVLAVVLTLFSAIVFFVMQHQLLLRIDQGLEEELADVLYEVDRAQAESDLLGWLQRRFARHEGFDFQITSESGARFFANERMASRTLPIPETVGRNSPTWTNLPIEDLGRWRVVTVIVRGPERPLIVQVARSLAALDNEADELLFAFFATGPLTLLIAGSGGYFLARRALAPVQNMTQIANEISAERLSGRIQVANPHDELGHLACTLNCMFGRLEKSFQEMNRFTADVAHELRTPLAVMRSETEIALRGARSGTEYTSVLENLLEETNRLTVLCEHLLLLSRHDAGVYPCQRTPVCLDQLVREVVGNMQPVAEAKGVILEILDLACVTVSADATRIRQVFYNLLDNAIKYTSPSGRIRVSVRRDDDTARAIVADTGIGIAPEHLDHVFDRFYRVDSARSEGTAAGLGLSLCKSILRAHNGDIRLESDSGVGTHATVLLPLQTSAAQE